MSGCCFCCCCCCRCLRAFRALLFTDDVALPEAACLQDMPPGLVLLHAFSRYVCEVYVMCVLCVLRALCVSCGACFVV